MEKKELAIVDWKRITLFSILCPVLRRCHRKNYGYFFLKMHVCTGDPDKWQKEWAEKEKNATNLRYNNDNGKTVSCDNVLLVNFQFGICNEWIEIENKCSNTNSLPLDYRPLTLFTTVNFR